ncbi:hypothetical protein [Escherichia coli]|uniref:hypothetical protein n=1 Tax=Escherichia coli TaxID=562 RepID=UPI0030F3CB83
MIELLILAVVLLYLAGVILMGAFQQAVDSDFVWFELVFWPFITLYAFTAAMCDNIMRAIKERKNGK